MRREEALAHFREQAVPAVRRNAMQHMLAYWQAEKTSLIDEFLRSFRELCLMIQAKQQAGEKGEIGFITYSMLRVELVHRRAVYLVQAADAAWLFDPAPIDAAYDATWAYRWLDRLMEELSLLAPNYAGAVTLAQLDRIRLREAEHVYRFVAALLRNALREAARLPELQELAKEEVFEVRIGEYFGHSECVFRLDMRERAAEEVKAWLGEKNDAAAYGYEDFNGLDLQGGEYRALDVRFSSFRQCNLNGSSWADGCLLGTFWENCRLDRADFGYSFAPGADYRSCSLQEAVFRRVHGKAGWPIADSALPGPEAIRFQDCDLTGADFADACLDGAMFVRASLRGASFRGARLRGAQFLQSDVSDADFCGADLTEADFRQANGQAVGFATACLDGARFPGQEEGWPQASALEQEESI